MPFVVPPVSTDLENLELDGLPLNDANLGLVALSCPPPRQRQEWIGAADSEWQALTRDPLYENRKITATIQVAPAGNMDGALSRIGQIRDKLKKASADPSSSIPLVWQPAESMIPVTFDVLAGEITDLPIDWDNGWFAKAPTVTIELTAKPYWRADEVILTASSGSLPVLTATVANTVGDVPALGRLIVTDLATQSRRHVEWGLEGPLTYNAATSLLLTASSDLVVTGFAGTKTTGGTGIYGTAPNQIETLASTTPTALCGTGNQSHVGAFRVKARGYWYPNTQVRLSWKVGDGPMSSNAWADTAALSGSWAELDLGMVTIPPVLAGTQRWTGQIDVRTTSSTANAYLNYLVLVPVTAGYGKARATYSYQAGVLVGSDDFAGTTAGNALNARVAPSGGTWATSGAATDFAFADDLSGEQVKRTTTSDATPRFAVLGSNRTDTEISARVQQTSTPGTTSTLDLGVLARWVDASNYVRATFTKYTSGGAIVRLLVLEQVVAGTPTTLASATLPTTTGSNAWYTVRIIAFASGLIRAQLFSDSGTELANISASSTAVATGGALATGKPGLYDRNLSAQAITRYYDDVALSTPSAEPIVVYSGQSIEFRHDQTIREDATGTYYGRPQSYRGSRFLVPVGTSRLLVKARRNNIDETADPDVTDNTQVQVAITPRGLAVPRG